MGKVRTATFMLVFLAFGCDPTLPEPIEIRPPGPGDTLPSWDFLGPQESQALRDQFDWFQTTEVLDREEVPPNPGPVDPGDPPVPSVGRIALHYVMIYVRSPDQLLELEELGAHVRAVPIFEEEWAGVPDGPLKFPLLGDGEGIFVYSIMPGPMYNAIRSESTLVDEPPLFDAIVARPIPAAAQTSSGTVDYEYLKERGFDYDVDDLFREDLEPPWGLETSKTEAEPLMSDGAPKGFGRRIRRAIRRLAEVLRGVVDGVRMTFGAIATAVAPDTDLTFVLNPIETDNAFGGGTPGSLPMIRAWGVGAGQPMQLTDTRYVVRQFGGLSIDRGRTGATSGGATETILQNQPFRVCAEADASAARVERSIFWPVQACSVPITPTGPVMFAPVNVLDVDFNILMQAVDSYEYSREILEFTPRKAIIQAGPLNAVLNALNNGRSFAPCGSRTSSSFNLFAEGVFGSGPLPLPVAGLGLEFISAVDIVMANGNLANRGVATHEYGHFVLCDMLAQANERAFDVAWTEISTVTILGGEPEDSDALALNEGFADWFAAQVMGGVNRFTPAGTLPAAAGAGANGVSRVPMWYANPAAVIQGGGMEENIGSLACGVTAFPQCQFSPPLLDAGGSLLPQETAEMATLFHDLTDGWPAGTSNPGAGAFWVVGAAGSLVPVAPTGTGSFFPDEPVQLSGSDFLSGFRDWALLPSGRFNKTSVFPRFSRRMRMRGLTNPQICQAYSLHANNACPATWL